MREAVARALREGGITFVQVEPPHSKFYRLTLLPDLFGGVNVTREWGRWPAGARPGIRSHHHATMTGARLHLGQLVERRLKRRYRMLP